MNEKLNESNRSLGGDIERVDAHKTQPGEYQEVPVLNDGAVERERWVLAGRASLARGGQGTRTGRQGPYPDISWI